MCIMDLSEHGNKIILNEKGIFNNLGYIESDKRRYTRYLYI